MVNATPQRVYVCTKCIKKGEIKKA
jgi:ribosomal protein L28